MMEMSMSISYELSSLPQTQYWAEQIAALCQKGDVITLTGDLGVGKTTFVQYFCQALACDISEVSSPTFGLVHIYTHTPPLWHFDLYRLHHEEDMYELGWDEALTEGISLVEWPQLIQSFLPCSRLDLIWAWDAPGPRTLTFAPQGSWVSRVQHAGIGF